MVGDDCGPIVLLRQRRGRYRWISRAVWRASSRSACQRFRDSRSRPAERGFASAGRIRQRLAEADAVGEAMRDDQAHYRTAIGEGQHREVPSSSVLGIGPPTGLFTHQASNSLRGRGIAAISRSD